MNACFLPINNNHAHTKEDFTLLLSGRDSEPPFAHNCITQVPLAAASERDTRAFVVVRTRLISDISAVASLYTVEYGYLNQTDLSIKISLTDSILAILYYNGSTDICIRRIFAVGPK